MARLTGLTIDIGGNTKKLNEALKEPKKNADDLKSKLNEVNRALKFDPTNTELLTQKQDLLKETISATDEKLKLLKKAQQDFKDSSGDLNSKAYVQLEHDIASTEHALESLKEQQTQVSSTFQKLSSEISNFGDKATNLGKSLLPVTATITGLGVASMKSFNEVDEAVDTIAKKTGATGDAMTDFKDVFDDVASTIPAEMTDIGASIGEINTRLGFTGDKLTEASEQFLRFVEINDVDVNSAVQLVSRAMGDAGMEADEYSNMLDMLTKASQISGISIERLTESITKYGAPMRALGFDTASSIALFSQWEKAGVTTETAFSGMKKAISNWGKEGKDSREEFKKTLKEIERCPDIASATSKAIEVFGAKAGSDLADAIQGGRFSYEEFMKVIENSEGTVTATFEETEDGVDKVKVAMNSGKIAMAEFGEVISDSLAPILDTLIFGLKGLTAIFKSMPAGVKQIIVIIGLLVGALGPLLIIIGQISKGVSSAILVFGKMGPAFTKLSNIVGTSLSAIKSVGLTALSGLKTGGLAILNGFKTAGLTTLNLLKNGALSIFNTMKTASLSALGALKTVGLAVLNGLKTLGTTVLTSLSSAATTAFGILKTVAIGAFDAILAHPIIAGITAIIAIIVLLYTKCEWFRDGVNNILNSLGSAIKGCLDWIVNLFTSTIPKTIDSVVGWFQELPGRVLSALINLPGNLYNLGLDMLNKFVAGILEMFGIPQEKASAIADSIVNVIKDLPSKFYNWGKEMITNLGNGIVACGDWVADKAKGIAGSIASFLHFTRPDEGPLRDYETWMPDFIQGMAKGITNNVGILRKAVGDVSSTLVVDPNVTRQTIVQKNSTGSSDSGLINTLINKLDNLNISNQDKGMISMPIYLGNKLLDELILDCNARQLVKSGGRS